MTNDIAIRYCDEYLARHIADIDKEFLKKANNEYMIPTITASIFVGRRE